MNTAPIPVHFRTRTAPVGNAGMCVGPSSLYEHAFGADVAWWEVDGGRPICEACLPIWLAEARYQLAPEAVEAAENFVANPPAPAKTDLRATVPVVLVRRVLDGNRGWGSVPLRSMLVALRAALNGPHRDEVRDLLFDLLDLKPSEPAACQGAAGEGERVGAGLSEPAPAPARPPRR